MQEFPWRDNHEVAPSEVKGGHHKNPCCYSLMHINKLLRSHRRCRFMTLLVNFVSMSVHLRSAKEGPSIMRRTCICRGNEQQSLLLPRVSCPCSSHAEDEYAASRAAKAGFCLVPALVSLSVQSFPTES